MKIQYRRLRAVNNRSVTTRRHAAPGQPEPSATITSTGTEVPWTGAVLTGWYQKNATSAKTKSYLANEATFNVPAVTPGLYHTGTAQMSIWNGLDNNTLLQAIVWVQTTSTHANYFIHRQCFAPHGSSSAQGDGAGVLFTPNAGDSVFAEEWYCDASGNPNLSGGYACTHMRDDTQNLVWDCSQANSTECASYQLASSALTNGNLGQEAEFAIENDTGEEVQNVNDWPPFAAVKMSGRALVVTGSGAGSTLEHFR